MIKTEKFTRKPFIVDAVQVTAENMEEVAEWCQGEVQETEASDKRQAEKFVHVRVVRPLTPRQTKAFVGDWVLYAGTGYKVYTQKAFDHSFDPVFQEVKKPIPSPKDVYGKAGIPVPDSPAIPEPETDPAKKLLTDVFEDPNAAKDAPEELRTVNEPDTTPDGGDHTVPATPTENKE